MSVPGSCLCLKSQQKTDKGPGTREDDKCLKDVIYCSECAVMWHELKTRSLPGEKISLEM
jgi:hypothetical protein